jgi:hypothetical protein
MKIVICSLMVSCFAALPAKGGESPDMFRDRANVCNQFVIEHPYPPISPEFWDSTECCGYNKRGHNCFVNDLGEMYR